MTTTHQVLIGLYAGSLIVAGLLGVFGKENNMSMLIAGGCVFAGVLFGLMLGAMLSAGRMADAEARAAVAERKEEWARMSLLSQRAAERKRSA